MSKRLTSKDYLTFKRSKETLGREYLILDFNKKHLGDWRKETVQQKQLSYTFLYSDTLKILRKLISKFDVDSHLKCYILCLRIISKIIKSALTADCRHTAYTLYIDCMLALSGNLVKLN